MRLKVMAILAVTAVGATSCAMTPERSARLMAFGQAMQGAGASMRTASPSYTPAQPGAGMACSREGEFASGVYKNCVYNCGAAGYVTRTVGAADFCPILLD